MNVVTHQVFDEIFGLLEAIEVTDGVDMAQFDPDDANDVRTLVGMHLRRVVTESIPENRELLRRSLAFYLNREQLPYQQMRDRCQELSLPDSSSWPLFFLRIGEELFGPQFVRHCDVSNAVEQNLERPSLGLFRRA